MDDQVQTWLASPLVAVLSPPPGRTHFYLQPPKVLVILLEALER